MTSLSKGLSWFSHVAATSIVGITMLALVSSWLGWWLPLELASHFQVQYTIASLLLWLLLLWSRRQIFSIPSIVGLFCLAILSTNILFWYIPIFRPPIQGQGLRVLIANVNTKNHQHSLLLNLIEQTKPDLALVMEVNDRWLEALQTLQPRFPYAIGRSADHNFGIVLLSRHPLQQPEIKQFGPANIASIVSQMTIAGQPLSFVATHPLPPKSEFFFVRNDQLAEVASYVQRLPPPIILAGDLNLSLWSPYYRQLVSKTGLVNTRRGFGPAPTWPSPGTYGREIPSFLLRLLAIPIDHCLISPDIQVRNLKTGPRIGSDHLPIIVDLVIPLHST